MPGKTFSLETVNRHAIGLVNHFHKLAELGQTLRRVLLGLGTAAINNAFLKIAHIDILDPGLVQQRLSQLYIIGAVKEIYQLQAAVRLVFLLARSDLGRTDIVLRQGQAAVEDAGPGQPSKVGSAVKVLMRE